MTLEIPAYCLRISLCYNGITNMGNWEQQLHSQVGSSRVSCVTESLWASALKRLVGVIVEETIFSWLAWVPLDISSLFTYHICWVFIPWKAESAPLAPCIYLFVWGWSVCCLPAGPWACLPFCIWSHITVPGTEWTHDRCWVNCCKPKTKSAWPRCF